MDNGVIVVLFDISEDEKSLYRSFMKHLKIEGYQIIQKSVYYKVVRNIRLSKYNIQQMKQFKKDGCNIKVIVLTISQFEKIQVISGDKIDLNLDSVVII